MPILKIYNGEFFERTKWRYIIIFLVIVLVIVLPFFYEKSDTLSWIFAAVIMLMIVWWYFFFQTKINSETKMVIKPEGLQVWERLIPYSMIKGFVVEAEKSTAKLRNIVLVYQKSVEIFTLKDTEKQAKLFFAELSKIVPFLEKYDQSWVEKFMRKIKL